MEITPVFAGEGDDHYADFSLGSSDNSDSDSWYTLEKPPRFVNEAAERRFEKFSLRPTLVERHFVAPTLAFEETICHYSWGLLTTAPASCNIEIAREYYANASTANPSEVQKKGVYLRGTHIKVTSHNINQQFLLPDYPEDEFGHIKRSMDAERILESVALPGTVWKKNVHSREMYVMSNDLTAEAKVWLLLINSRIMPTSFSIRTTRDKIFLIYAIQHRLTIDVGRVIMGQIQRAQNSRSIPMLFPFLLSELAHKRRVQIASTESKQFSLGTIGKPQWPGYLHLEYEERLRRNA